MLLQNASVWTPQAIAASVSAAVAFVALAAKGIKVGWDAYQSQRLQRSIGPEVYDPEAIHRAVRHYVEPNGTSVDPAQEAEPKSLVVAEEPVMRVLDRFMAEGAPSRHMVVLADSGMGKSSLLLNYYARNQRRRPSRRRRIALVHLGLPDADERIRAIQDRSTTALFLDAFDEDIRAIRDYRARIAELLELTTGFRRVLLTSRTQFFPADEEIPQETGLLKTGAVGMEKRTYQFRKLYLAPLSDAMVREYLRRRYSGLRLGARSKAWNLVRKVPLLSVRPMLLTYIPDLIDSNRPLRSRYQVYNELVTKWYERESPWVDKDALDAFSSRLAADIFIHRSERVSERISQEQLEPLARRWGISLDDWQLRGRSLLNRDAAGNYKFSHRSIMEFLVARTYLDTVSAVLSGNKSRIPDKDTLAALSRYCSRAAVQGAVISGAPIHLVAGGPEAFTEGIGEFIADGLSGILAPSHYLDLGVDPDDLPELVERIEAWVKPLAVEISRGSRETDLVAWLIAPAVYTDSENRSVRFDIPPYSSRESVPEIEAVSVYDHYHRIEWLVMREDPESGGTSRLLGTEGYRVRGWRSPGWEEKLAAVNALDRLMGIGGRDPVTFRRLMELGEQLSVWTVAQAVTPEIARSDAHGGPARSPVVLVRDDQTASTAEVVIEVVAEQPILVQESATP